MLKNMDAASLADSIIELSSRSLLIGKMMKEKNGNCVSLSEFEKLRTDLAEYKEKNELFVRTTRRDEEAEK